MVGYLNINNITTPESASAGEEVEIIVHTENIGSGCLKYFKVELSGDLIGLQEFKLEPGECAIRYVEIKDVWVVPAEELDYLVKQDFSAKHLRALQYIVGLFDNCEESEKEIFEFVDRLYEKYAS